jgi:hypothetical protein
MVRTVRSRSAAILAVLTFLAADAAAAEVLVNEPADTVLAMTATQPGGAEGLGEADGLRQVALRPVLPPARSVLPVPAADLADHGTQEMERHLYRSLRASASRLVIIDELGPALRGSPTARLARALELLSRRRASSKGDLARRVHVYVQAAGVGTSAKEQSLLRSVLQRVGGVWVKGFAPGGPWTDEQWRTLPGAVAALARRPGERPGARVHLVFGAGDLGRDWRLAGGAETCALLLNGPGSYEVGDAAPAFVAEYRRVFGPPGAPEPTTCAAPNAVDEGIARALQAAAAREATGIELAPAPAAPPLPVGAAAVVELALGSDPLGLAAAFGVTPEEMWARGGLRARVAGAGAGGEAAVDGDGTARVILTPAAPGALQATLLVHGPTLIAPLGPDADLVATLRRIGGDPTLLERVLADPAGWSLLVPVQPSGTPVGTPVAEAVAVP